MPRIFFILPDQSQHAVTVREGTSVMRAAVDAGMPGIVGECGGSASCGTCHVWVDPAWADRLSVPDEVELDMLDFVEAELRVGSRLACQIVMHAELDGLRIDIPPLER